jgi:DNA repair ATPase RecN
MGIIKTNIPGFVKDKKTNVVINTNNDFESYKKTRERLKTQKRAERETKQEIDVLKQQLNELQNLLKQVLDGKSQ